MKKLSQVIQEKLKIGSNSKVNVKYKPTSVMELSQLINKLMDERGRNADLTDIDVSEVKNMSRLFTYGKLLGFDGDISNWDVSNVENMDEMFAMSDFSGANGDISGWDIHNVKSMQKMFYGCKHLKIDLSNWNVDESAKTDLMFKYCPPKVWPKWWKH